MPIQLSTAVRNAQLDQFEVTTGASAVLQLRSGTAPADCAAANTGTVGATLSLPSDWMNAASGGTKTIAGVWTANASGSIVVGHFRLFNSTQNTCHMQGTVTNTGGGGDMTLDNVVLNANQSVTITAFTLTAGNA